MNDHFKSERVTKEKIKDIISLFKSVYGKQTSASYWQKKLDTAVYGPSYLGSIIYDEHKRAVAFYAVYPCRMNLNGKTVLGAVAGDGMTLREYRRRGLFEDLLKITHDLAKANGIEFIFGFPNQDSENTFSRAGIPNEKGSMKIYSLGVRAFPLAKMSFLDFLTRPWQKLILSKYLSEVKVTDETEKDNDRVIHDIDFYSYKNGMNRSLLQIAGRRVWIKIDKVMRIGDLEGMNNVNQNAMVKKMRRLAMWTGCTEIQFAANFNSSFTDELIRAGAKVASFPIVQIDMRKDELPDPLVNYKMCDNDTF